MYPAAVRRRRLPSSSYGAFSDDDECYRDELAEQRIAVFSRHKQIEQVARHVARGQHVDHPFYVMNIAAVHERVARWRRSLPTVSMFYSMQCNADPVLLATLANQPDIGFQVASVEELQFALSIVPASRIVFACGLWTRRAMKLAGEHAVGTLVIDSERQLRDVMQYVHSTTRIIVAVRLGHSTYPNGCSIEDAVEILETASNTMANLVGVSFHLGPGADGCQYEQALSDVYNLFVTASRLGLHLDTIGLGGGFEGDSFEEVAYHISNALTILIPSSISVFGAPGRFIAGPAFSLCTAVIGKQGDGWERQVEYETSKESVAIDARLADVHPECRPLFGCQVCPVDHSVSITGVFHNVPMNVCHGSLGIGDWLLWDNMGAYTMPLEREEDVDDTVPPVYYYAGKENWQRVKSLQRLDEDFDDGRSDGASVEEESVGSCEEMIMMEDDDDDILNPDIIWAH